MAKDYTAELLPQAESFDFCDEYKRTIRTVLITIQGFLKAAFPTGANIIGLVIEFLDRACGA